MDHLSSFDRLRPDLLARGDLGHLVQLCQLCGRGKSRTLGDELAGLTAYQVLGNRSDVHDDPDQAEGIDSAGQSQGQERGQVWRVDQALEHTKSGGYPRGSLEQRSFVQLKLQNQSEFSPCGTYRNMIVAA